MSRVLSSFLVFLLFTPFSLATASDVCPDLPLSSAHERVTALRGEIRHHDELYYQKMTPAISDAEYDTLFTELVTLERCFPALAAADSPSATVGGGSVSQPAHAATGTLLSPRPADSVVGDPAPQSPLLQHDPPMLSLSSSTGPEAVEALLHRIATGGASQTLLVQPKVDGLPVELMYQSGRLTSAATRGNGRYGEDVTSRVRRISGIPGTLSGSFPARVAVRGEIYADLALMASATETSTEAYATPRHFAAGALRSRDPSPLALTALRFFPFELVHAEAVAGVRSDLAAQATLADWGFPVRPELTWQAHTLEQIRALYQKYLAKRNGYPFAADGIVVKLDDLPLRRSLGEGARAPFWAAAWKFPPATAATRVRAIRWQVGRTGRRTPVAELEPVSLGGVRVSHVSLHNAETLSRLGIAAGDRVIIALAGDVIPQVQEVVKEESINAPGVGSVQKAKPAPALDACLRDTPDCRSQFLAKAAHFVSKAGLGIPGLGRGRLQNLITAGLVPDLPSIFRLTFREVAAVAGFGSKSARRLIAAIERARHPQQFRLVSALGIPGVGPAAAERLSGDYLSLDELLESKESHGRADTAGERVRSFFATRGGSQLLAELRKLGVI